MCDLLRIAIKAGNRARCYHCAVCLVTEPRERERARDREIGRGKGKGEFTETTNGHVPEWRINGLMLKLS